MPSLASSAQNYKSTIAGCAMVLVVGSASFLISENNLYELLRIRAELSQLEDSIFEKQGGNDQLRKEIHRLETNPREIERRARQQLGLVRPGELVYVTELDLADALASR